MPSTGKRAVGERVRVSDAFDLRMGKTPSRKNPLYWRDGSHDWVSIADLGSFGKYVGETKEQINDLAIRESGIKPAPADTVLMSFKLSLGKTSITTVPVYTNEAIMAFVDKGTYPVCLDFIYHQCRSKDWAVGTNAAVKGKTLNKGSLERATIYLPDLDKQKEIAARFDSIDGQIAKAENQVEWLGALVKSRFVEMFGDPLTNSKGLPTRRGLSLFKIANGKAKPSTQRYEDGIPAYGGNGVSWYTDEAMVDEPTIVIGRVGRHCGNARLVGEPCWVTDNAMYIRDCRADEIDLVYLVTLMEIVDFNQYADKGDLWKITQAPFMEFEFPLPPLALQREFAEFVAHVDHLESLARQSIAKLQLLYDSLAQDYFGTPEA